MDPIRLSGRVKYVHSQRNPVVFSVVSFQSQKIFKCTYDGFAMIHVNDVVMLVCVRDSETDMRVVAAPYLIVTDEKDVVIHTLIQATKGLRDKKLTLIRATKLYEWLMNKIEKIENIEEAVSKYLSKLAHDYSCLSDYPRDLETLLEVDQITHILSWWERYHDRRRLWMLGLNDEDIRKSKMAPADLYDLCTTDPFRVSSLDLAKCQQILARQGQSPNDDQILCGMISRMVYDNQRKKGWSGTPKMTVLERFNRLHELKDILISDYHLVFDRHLIFLKHAYETEKNVAEYIINSLRQCVEPLEVNLDDISPSLDQRMAITGALNSRISIITGPAGTGKCLAPETPVLMHSGRIIQARFLEPGDRLMGDDGQERTILSTIKGHDRMFRIIAEDESTFVCNYPHVLTLIREDGSLFDIPLNEYLECPVEGKLYRPPVNVADSTDFLDSIDLQRNGIDYILWSTGRSRNNPMDEKRILDFRIEYIGYGPYFGFELDGNGRFLLGNFIVTHNTTSIRGIVQNLEQNDINYGICTPTGKAASRVQQAIARPAYTIHRYINKIKKTRGGLETELIFPLGYLIIDEASMVTTELFNALIEAVKSVQGGILFSVILVGDINQLPPIEWGSLMESCLYSRRVPTFYLTENHRQRSGNGIIKNATAMISHLGCFPFEFEISPTFWVQNGTVHDVKTHLQLWREQGIKVENIKIITPYVKELPILNYLVQTIFFEGQPQVKDPRGLLWNVGDLVIMLVNNYEIDVMNGDEGRIIEVDGEGITVLFKEKSHKFRFPTLEEIGKRLEIDPVTGESKGDLSLTTMFLTHSFALSVHKSQGSEWQKVIIFIPEVQVNAINFVNRNLLYTGITRARDSIVCVGSEMIFGLAVNSRSKPRYESLKGRLEEELSVVAPELPGSLTISGEEEDEYYDEDY